MALPRRQTTVLPALPQDAKRELAALELELGGRQQLVRALTFARQTKDVRYLLGMLGDPENSSRSLADICHSGQILPGEVVAALSAGTELRSQLLAKTAIARRLPDVVTEVMQKAAEYEDDCSECMGTGKITADPTADQPNPSPQDCTTCQATGRLRYPADGKCRDLALEMAGLTGNGPGVQVTTNVQVNAASGAGYEQFERLQEAMDRVLYGQEAAAPPVEAEVVPPPEDPANA